MDDNVNWQEITEEEAHLLALLIQAEAGGEPMEGKIAVGAVVVNRLHHPSFPDTITEVILQERQFESVELGRLEKIQDVHPDCVTAARRALQGSDPTNGALYFYNPASSQNRWIRERKIAARLGRHVFCY